MAEHGQHLIDLVEPYTLFALFQITDEPEPHTRPISQLLLRQPQFTSTCFHKPDYFICRCHKAHYNLLRVLNVRRIRTSPKNHMLYHIRYNIITLLRKYTFKGILLYYT